ncbi:hypothetical protein P5E41_10250 [Clostridium perfringens]|uniref:hypothetical protein n=1 Tax=Clostridium perfringens TaxID=1502 RepID=UPI0018E474AD|nr:hypothetical protein [Clostridium perfringens]MBI6051172.1 hypothetical protein [Clostridium perfringens]MDK0843671.1 hypothetical protein [Clostridium perfringens]HAT4217980.1 hypothetical protein [Clostridium perfringens]
MKVISCASYYGTGSSAITDFFSEFDNVYSLTNYEFRFLQDPDGISDLEFNLIENHNRHNSGHSIKRFKKLVDFNAGTFFNKRYEPFFNNQYKQISYDYIKELTDFSFNGYWFYDFYDRGKLFYYRKMLPGKIYRKLFPSKSESSFKKILPNEITYCSHPSEEKFLRCTRAYVSKLVKIANKDNKPYIMVDQMVPPSNVSRYTRYFEDIKVFVVERDPRDVYLLAKYVWKARVIPTESVELFCQWFRYTRLHRKTEKYNSENTILIQFEDLIYHYDETIQKIMTWVGISAEHHEKAKQYFNPDKSINNTKLWEKYPQYIDEIRKLEELLPEYLYCDY